VTGEVSGAYLLLLVLQRGTGTVIMGLVCRVVETWAGLLTNSLYSSLTENEESRIAGPNADSRSVICESFFLDTIRKIHQIIHKIITIDMEYLGKEGGHTSVY